MNYYIDRLAQIEENFEWGFERLYAENPILQGTLCLQTIAKLDAMNFPDYPASNQVLYDTRAALRAKIKKRYQALFEKGRKYGK